MFCCDLLVVGCELCFRGFGLPCMVAWVEHCLILGCCGWWVVGLFGGLGEGECLRLFAMFSGFWVWTVYVWGLVLQVCWFSLVLRCFCLWHVVLDICVCAFGVAFTCLLGLV